MIRRQPQLTRTYTLLPSTYSFRSVRERFGRIPLRIELRLTVFDGSTRCRRIGARRPRIGDSARTLCPRRRTGEAHRRRAKHCPDHPTHIHRDLSPSKSIASPRGNRAIVMIFRSEEHTSELQSLMHNSYAV